LQTVAEKIGPRERGAGVHGFASLSGLARSVEGGYWNTRRSRARVGPRTRIFTFEKRSRTARCSAKRKGTAFHLGAGRLRVENQESFTCPLVPHHKTKGGGTWLKLLNLGTTPGTRKTIKAGEKKKTGKLQAVSRKTGELSGGKKSKGPENFQHQVRGRT